MYRIAEWLKQQPEIEVAEEKDYYAAPKPNGYRSIAMLITSFAVGVLVLMLTQGANWSLVLLLAGVGALIGAATELFTPSEYETVTVPVMILAVLLMLQGI